MINLLLTENQRRLIILWHETVIDRYSRHGNGVATFPDEASILGKLWDDKTTSTLFTHNQIEQMIDWGESATAKMPSIDDDHLLKTLGAVLPNN